MKAGVNLPFSTFTTLAWRNLWRHRRRTIITLSSIAIGFGLTVFSIGIQDNSHHSMVKNAINMGEGHITLQQKDYLASPANHRFIHKGAKTLKQVESLGMAANIAPRIFLQVLASTANNSIGAGIQAIKVETDPIKNILKPKLIDGEWLESSDKRGLLIGENMARKLKVKIGSKIVVMAGKKGGETEAQLGRVRGIFRSGSNELDSFLIITHLAFGQMFLVAEGANQADQPLTRIAVFLHDEKQLEISHKKISQVVSDPELSVLSWQQMLPLLVQYIVIDDASAYLIQIFILLIIVFGIVNTILMSVLERTREFGLLRALGLQRNSLVILVLCESLILSVLAVGFGWMLGGAIHWYVAVYGIDFSSMIPEGTTFAGTFMDPVVYSELSGKRIMQLTTIVFFTTLASGIYPAIKASKVTPIEALRT